MPCRLRRERRLGLIGFLGVSRTARLEAEPGFQASARVRPPRLLFRWVSIFSITAGSSMQAMTFTAPPQWLQVSISMWNTHLSRCDQVIDARRSTGVRSCVASGVLVFLPLARFAGVTCARCLLLGAKTP